MKFARFSFLLLFVLCLGAAAGVQDVDLSGTWVGYAERMGSQDALTMVLEKKNGVYAGKISDSMGMFPDVEVTEFALKDGQVTFQFAGGSQDGSFVIKAELALSGETMKGTWKMVGVDQEAGAMELSRKK